MRIGILTYHRPYNFGATLQSIATRYFLTTNGHEVVYIDYFPSYHRDMYRLFNYKMLLTFNILRSIRYTYNSLKSYKIRRKRIRHYIPFIELYIEPYCQSYESTIVYDMVIYGSDQIWRKQPGIGSFNPIYFGEGNIRTKKKVSYAASMGDMTLDEKDKLYLEQKLCKFDKIGVRESKLGSILCNLGINATCNLDPTFLLTSTQWDNILRTKRLIDSDYVLYYKVSPGFDDSIIQNYCNKHNLKLIKVYSLGNYKESDYDPDPSEFVSLLKYAKFVFTTSFHGLAFSLIYKKQFLASCSTKSERLINLLSSLDLEERFADGKCNFEKLINHEIDYNVVNSKLSALIEDSKHFLLDIE